MKMKKYTYLLLILISHLGYTQCLSDRYLNEIFSDVTLESNINYSETYSDVFHQMDVYTPTGDAASNRPLIIYMHGGSFYGGDKVMADCVDFCESFAKRGYVCASINYRLSNPISFFLSKEEQYETVLEAVSDAKSAIRYFRKFSIDYGVNPNQIFLGGYSAGGVLGIHLAYIDDISDLPTNVVDNDGTTIINVQNLVNNIGGDLEGDGGHDGYSSSVQGVISFAGGINNLDWIDGNDEPLVSIQGTNDLTVNYNCGPGMNNSQILNLCGAGEMHPKANDVGILNDKLIFSGEGHNWAASGNINPKLQQALQFTADFLCSSGIINSEEENIIDHRKQLVKTINLLGQPITKIQYNTPLLYVYSNGEVERKIIIK